MAGCPNYVQPLDRLLRVADACVRLGLGVRSAPSGIRPVAPGSRAAGPALTVRHLGSVDVFLETLATAQHGDVLVIDNNGRLDEACTGDLALCLRQASHRPAGLIMER